MNKLHLKDKLRIAYKAYDASEKFHSPEKMSIKNYKNEFERLLNKTKKYGSAMSPEILAYRLLKFINLEDTQETLIRTTVAELTYDETQLQLKKIFGEKDSELVKSSGTNIKMEANTSYEGAAVYYQIIQPSNKRFNPNNNR